MSGDAQEHVAVGMRLWMFDHNRRVTARTTDGYKHDGFVEMQVVAESRTSWIVAFPGTPAPDPALLTVKTLPSSYRSIDKKTMRERGPAFGYGARTFYTDRGREDAAWIQKHRHRLSNFLQQSTDVAALRQIAVLLKYEEGGA